MPQLLRRVARTLRSPSPSRAADPAIPQGYADGFTAPMDGSFFIANVEWLSDGPDARLLRNQRVRWGDASASVRAVIGDGVRCFDTADGTLGLQFWQGACCIHSWRPLQSPGTASDAAPVRS